MNGELPTIIKINLHVELLFGATLTGAIYFVPLHLRDYDRRDFNRLLGVRSLGMLACSLAHSLL